MSEIVVTGMGAISSIGLTVAENLYSLQQEISGIQKSKHFKSNYSDSLVFGEIDRSDEQLFDELNLASKCGFTRTTLIALKAFREAIAQAGLSSEEISSKRTAFISSSTVGGMCYTDHLYQDANLLGEPSEYVRNYEGSDHALQIVKLYEMKGITDVINTACSSSANAIALGARLLETGKVDRVIAGGSDCLAKFTVNGFNSLRILSEVPCKPFDTNREGLSLGEAAAYVVLERKEDLLPSKTSLAKFAGFGICNDAFHPSATSDDARGPRMAMELALKRASLKPADIQYINAHGTGTPNNDLTESVAFSKLFEVVPPFSSTKSYVGHTLATAGVLEAIYSILAIQNQEIYPSLRVEEPIADFPFAPTLKYTPETTIQNVLSNSFGFGGNCTSLIFSACI
ncbi:beta-ketoacyl-[acyl-carrier-protein] synthase family protein [Fluviicola taffensis]|uniref:Beta-ketoacyl-acyl-carrier-protein synthase I n=1 Tax=Fluviicola taffensis (strain DSM 16823 / NCIMB 13979 / RW262) TaxID=755732 RepID=F2IEC3_FLUTR|nr:beta-ketoacyl-[acyl-carrier-protein] synthase family protein [Fluviicola taffensis]AEA43447.1 Beta-ketoacyl-acyl-carrier-protein synthase I [Fluviicola taffensis DSM 16823]